MERSETNTHSVLTHLRVKTADKNQPRKPDHEYHAQYDQHRVTRRIVPNRCVHDDLLEYGPEEKSRAPENQQPQPPLTKSLLLSKPWVIPRHPSPLASRFHTTETSSVEASATVPPDDNYAPFRWSIRSRHSIFIRTLLLRETGVRIPAYTPCPQSRRSPIGRNFWDSAD